MTEKLYKRLIFDQVNRDISEFEKKRGITGITCRIWSCHNCGLQTNVLWKNVNDDEVLACSKDHADKER